jgi:hypothetical protein
MYLYMAKVVIFPFFQIKTKIFFIRHSLEKTGLSAIYS